MDPHRDVDAMDIDVSGPKHTGAKLAAERDRRGITQEALAQRMGVTPARISAIESGRHKLRPESITRYMACLELITHGRHKTGDVVMRLTVPQVRWLSIFSHLTEDEQNEATKMIMDRFADRVSDRMGQEQAIE